MKRLLTISLAILLALSLSVVLLPAQPAIAQPTIYVDDDAPNDPGPGDPTVSDPDEDGSAEHPFDEIQEGIDAAVSGDTVQVAAGTYNENITLKSGVIVQGAGADVTTIDDGGSRAVVTGVSDSTIAGFTITVSSTYGYGIYCSRSSPTVTNNTFTCTGPGSRGIWCYNSSPTVTNNTFTGTGRRVGIYCIGGPSQLRVTNNIFIGQSIDCDTYSQPTIINNIFTDCGISAHNHSAATITNNTIVGGGISCSFNVYYVPTITNNIITGGANGISCYNTYPPTMSYNDVWGNLTNYSGCSPGPNDISEDPMFVDTGAGDYHLQPGSPCIDAGDNTAVPSWLTTDFEGDPRIEDGDDDTVAVVDMGADEFVPVNEPPVADAGADQTVEQTSYEGAEVILDGSGSDDPDGDPLTYSWTWDGGSDSGVSPTVLLPLGTTTVTLVVNDGELDSDPDTVDITVQDTTPPEVTADLIPIKNKEDKGTCTLVYNVIDICDPNPTVTVVIELPFAEDIDYEYKYKNGVIEVKGPSITLRVTAVDASGNVGTDTVTLEFTG